MSTPRKNYNYTSPYSKPIHTQQYPSQLEEYISLDMGGRSSQPRKNARDSGPKNSNQRRGPTNYIGNSYGSCRNQQKLQWNTTPRKTKTNDVKTENVSILSYLHPSMTEDPWLGLMKRLEAIENSSISLKVGNESYNCLEPMETVEQNSSQHPV